jgi:hypothetical protein
MHISRSGWLVALGFVLGCSGGNDGPGDDAGSKVGETGNPETFCTDFIGALCTHFEQCGCLPEQVSECRELLTRCDSSDYVFDPRALLASGDVTFHAEALRPLIARLRDPKTPCRAMFSDLGFDSVSVYTFAGVWLGTRAPGESCPVPLGQKGGVNTCKPGAFCVAASRTDDAGRCVVLAARGEACDLGPAPRRMCFDKRPPDNDDEFESAFDFLVCIPNAPGATEGTCRAELADGSPCESGESCKSGRCAEPEDSLASGSCAAKLAVGGACDWSGDCVSGACGDGRCSGLIANGSNCDFDSRSCMSQSCHAPDNQTDGTSPGVCGPKLDKPLGASCTQGYECASDVCRGDKCLNPICH